MASRLGTECTGSIVVLITVLLVGVAASVSFALIWHYKKDELKVMYPRCFKMWADTSRFKIVYATLAML